MGWAGINDFAHVDVHDIRTALPFLKASGLPFYVHAEQIGGDHVQVLLSFQSCT